MRCPVSLPSMRSTKIWLLATDRASGMFRYVNTGPQPTLRANSTQILKVVEVEKTEDVRRPYIKQLLVKNLKFPLPHRINKKAGKKIFASKRPSTFF